MEELPVDLVFRSVGYRGVAVPGLPFDERRGVIPHLAGRVLEPAAADPAQVTGFYVAGWIKRGPSGVIGTNKPDAAETAESMLADAAQGRTLAPELADIEPLLASRQPDRVTWPEWVRLAEREAELGKTQGRPRVKHTTIAEMLAIIRKQ